jgi:hypothetical protein
MKIREQKLKKSRNNFFLKNPGTKSYKNPGTKVTKIWETKLQKSGNKSYKNFVRETNHGYTM